MNENDIFKNARLKVERADRHIDALIADSRSLPRSLWAFRYGQIHASVGDVKVFTDLSYVPKKPIPEHFSAYIGDALHNLRSALDIACTGMVSHADPSRDVSRLAFPFNETRENLITGANYRAVKETFSDAERLILDEIQPYRAGNFKLWAISQSDNVDKHNGFVPTIAVATIGGLTATFGNNNVIQDCSVGNNASKPFGIFGGGPFAMNDNVKPTVDVRFSEDSLFGPEPVIETLFDCRQIVSETINSLETLMAA